VPMPMYKDDYDVSDSDTKTQILEGFSGASTVMLPGFSNASTVVLEDPILESAPTEVLAATRKEQRFRAAYEAYQKDFAERSAVKEAEDKQKEEEKQRMMLSSKEKEEYQKQQLFLEKKADADIMTSMGLPLKKSRIDKHHKPATTQEKDVSSYITELLGGSKDLAAVALSGTTPMYHWTRREAKDHTMYWVFLPDFDELQFTSSHFYSMDSTDNEILIHHGTIAGTLTNENGDGDGKVTTVSFRESVLWENSSGHKLLAMSPSGKEIYVVAQDSELNKEGFDPDGDDNDLMNVSFTLHRIRLSDSVDIKDRMKPVHHVEMNKQMKWVGTEI